MRYGERAFDIATADLRRDALGAALHPDGSPTTRIATEIIGVLGWYAAADLPRSVLAPLGRRDDVDAALADLLNDGAVRLDRDHVRTVGKVDRIGPAAVRAVDLLDRAWPRDDDPRAWDRLLPHIEHLLAQDLPGAATERASGLREATGCFLVGRGEPARGTAHLVRVHRERVRLLGERHPETLRARSNLAYAYTVGGRPVRAVPLLREVVGDRVRALGADHPQTLKARGNLAVALEAAGDQVKAVRLFERLLDDLTRVLGEDHADTVRIRAGLAFAHAGGGRPGEAVPLLQHVVRHHTREFGAHDVATLAVRGALACAYESAGELDRAAWLFERLLAEQERVLGPDHPDTRCTRENLTQLGGRPDAA